MMSRRGCGSSHSVADRGRDWNEEHSGDGMRDAENSSGSAGTSRLVLNHFRTHKVATTNAIKEKTIKTE